MPTEMRGPKSVRECFESQRSVGAVIDPCQAGPGSGPWGVCGLGRHQLATRNGGRETESERERERERGEGDDKRERVVMSPEPAWDYCHGLSFRWPQLLAARDRLGALKLGSSAAPACPDYPHLFHKIRIAPRHLLNQLHLLPSWSPNHTVWSVARSVPLSVQPVPLLAT